MSYRELGAKQQQQQTIEKPLGRKSRRATTNVKEVKWCEKHEEKLPRPCAARSIIMAGSLETPDNMLGRQCSVPHTV